MDGRHLSLRKRLGLELYRRLHREAVERHELRTLFWECTLRCNLRCGHCGSDCTASPDCQDMPAEDFFRVLDRQITPRVDPHRVMVVLSGGEVLVRSDLERIAVRSTTANTRGGWSPTAWRSRRSGSTDCSGRDCTR